VTTFADSLFTALESNELVTPYLQNCLTDGNWPDEFRIPMKRHDSWDDDYFHPSSHCTASPRWLYYQMHPEHRKRRVWPRQSHVDVMSPLWGTVAHVIIQQKLKHSGLVSDEHIEIPLRNERCHGRGHLDLLFPNHPQKGKDIPVDIKSVNGQSFDRVSKKPYPYQILQEMMYQDWMGADEGVILFVERDRPFRMREYRVRTDKELLRPVYEKWEYVRECLMLGTPPQKPCCGWNSGTMEGCNARVPCRKEYP